MKWYDQNGTDIDAYPERAFQGGVYSVQNSGRIAWHCKFCDFWNTWTRINCKDCGRTKNDAMDRSQ